MSSISIIEYHALTDAKGRAPSKPRRSAGEEELHRVCMEWVARSTARYPILEWALQVPHDGQRLDADKHRAPCEKRGVMDLLLPFPNGGWKGLAVKFKSATGRVTKDQQRWLERADEAGYMTGVCRSIDDFERVIETFLKG